MASAIIEDFCLSNLTLKSILLLLWNFTVLQLFGSITANFDSDTFDSVCHLYAPPSAKMGVKIARISPSIEKAPTPLRADILFLIFIFRTHEANAGAKTGSRWSSGASVYSPEGLYPPLCWIILWTVRFRNHTVILLEEIKNWKNYIPCLMKTVTFFFAESPASEKVNLPTGKRCTCPDRKYHCWQCSPRF